MKSNWWNNFDISCLCLSQLVGSTADVKTLPNGFFHISQSATSDFFWIFLYLMPQVLLIPPPSTANKNDINRKIQLKICQSLYTTDAQGAIFAIFITFENFDNVDTFNEHWDLKKKLWDPKENLWDHTKTYSVCNRDAGGTSKKYKFWGFLQSLGFDKTFIVGLCCCIWAITSQQNVFYTVWPPPKR